MATNSRSMQITLPDDMVFDILCRLPIESIVRFKSVCKSWNCMIQDPVFINSQISWSKVHPPKLLLTADAEPSSFFLTETSEFKAKKLMDINDVEDPIVMCSFNGLICIGSRTRLDPLKICNPVTRESLELPHSNFANRVEFHQVALGYDNITKRYKVVRSYKAVETWSRIEILTLGETIWKKFSTRNVFYERYGPVFHDGAFHWTFYLYRQLVQFDLSTDGFHISPPLFLAPFPQVLHYLSLLNVEGRLLLTFDDLEIFYIFGVDGSRHYVIKEDLKRNGIEGDFSDFCNVDLISMPSPDNYILRVTMNRVEDRITTLVNYHTQNRTVTLLCSDDFNVISFKPSLLSPNMVMSSGTV
ncbi:hypothetical protein L6164_013517 [Bauhinia variegata]|uniref:Uncharacterized protein n=1 Tax=Bauhinia variegata TaxID=167791 RepID=A0ACB9NG44_BAUVA|nr:hypothetical protein L6164_013517 [Bauhinia variegata]